MPVATPLPDLRQPGRPMGALQVKLPAALIGSLQTQADRIGASRGALARALVARGLQEMEQPSAAD
jgi:hypothetical protein